MSFATIATIALAASASFVSAAPIVARNESSTPSTYAEGYLEQYDVYHARYIALDCKTHHNTTFFDDCCHPLLANETLADDRASYCSPNATVSASVASTIAEYTATATASATASADVEAESAYESASVSVDEAASTASYSLVSETASATATESDSIVSETASATATASVDNAENWAHKHESSSASATATSTEAEAYPTTTSSAEEEASTTSSEEYTSTSTSAAAASTTSSSSSEVMTGGYATFFYQDGVAGECGTVHSDSDYIIAIDANGWWSDYESNDDSPYCGKSITITNTNNGKTVTATVADVCPTCDTNNSLDLSVGAFTAIASESDGQVPITWVWA